MAGLSAPDRSPALILFVAGAVLVGVLTATQSRVNSELSQRLGDGYLAAIISFGSGLLILLVVLAVWAPGPTGARRLIGAVRSGATPWWYLGGGVAGGAFVLAQGLSAAALGVALFTIAVVSGQTASGLVVDRLGLGTMAPTAITVTRLGGSILALAAVGWAVSSQLRADTELWVVLLPLLAGIGLGWQQAANGQVRVAAGSAMTATLMNFVSGTLVLILAGAVHLAVAGWPTSLPAAAWLYSGGLIGTLFIGLAIIVVKHTGVLLLGLGVVAGQLVASLALDVLVPVAGHPIAWTTVLGTALTLVAVGIATIPSRPIGQR